jgi:phage family integrase/recombinase protein
MARYNRKTPPRGWEEPIDHWAAWLTAQGLRPSTIRVKKNHIVFFARCNPDLQPHDLTVEAVLDWAATRAWKPETRHGNYGSFSQFMTWLQGKKITFPAVRRPRTLARPVPDEVIEGFLHGPDARACLAIRLAAYAGLRRCEIPLTNTADLIDGIGGRSVLVHGKGGHERLVPLSQRLDAAIRDYQADHGIEQGWLFPGGTHGHLGADRIGKMVNDQLPKPWTLHGLRHRFATAVYRATRDIIVVQQLLGHASVATTQRYLAFTDDSLRAAVNLADH